MANRKGLFLAFEGIDGSGKSVQARKISAELNNRGINCILTAEPTDGLLGNRIKSEVSLSGAILNNMTLQILFTADRSDHVNKTILPYLQRGFVVITDRYYWSTAAYGYAFGLDVDWLLKMNSIFPKPDITFWFDVDPSIAESRRQQRLLKQKIKVKRLEANNVQKRVHRGYEMLASKYGKDGWHIVDAGKSIDEIFEEIMAVIEKKLEKLG